MEKFVAGAICMGIGVFIGMVRSDHVAESARARPSVTPSVVAGSCDNVESNELDKDDPDEVAIVPRLHKGDVVIVDLYDDHSGIFRMVVESYISPEKILVFDLDRGSLRFVAQRQIVPNND